MELQFLHVACKIKTNFWNTFLVYHQIIKLLLAYYDVSKTKIKSLTKS